MPRASVRSEQGGAEQLGSYWSTANRTLATPEAVDNLFSSQGLTFSSDPSR
eukprot:CAMPEP_0173374432 /NCGR_PEP_ID=MMETSP1144-20121109/29074_1 /TAXON_ID=483371 /ORGANISM="non described non described, Strain CCMP2298" /LENGTH=50 /DNA_ID=CAMNT_0014326765 /DNA_START=749 /DNA_END=898 /DNA_ORIENTATION=+